MAAITLSAHFDGQQIQLDEPFELEPDTKLLITVLPKQPGDVERNDWLNLSTAALENAYGEDEPEYSLELITEANPAYEGR